MSHQLMVSETTLVKVIAMLFAIASLGEVVQCRLFEDGDRTMITSPEEAHLHQVYRRSKPTLAESSSSVLDPSSYVVRQNGEQRRSRLYIGKRPRTLQLDGLADDDEETNQGPLLELLRLQQAQGGKLNSESKRSPSFRVKRRSTSGSMHVQASVNSSPDVDKARSREKESGMNEMP